MDDLEITKRVAEAMGIKVVPTPPNQPPGVWHMQDVGHWAPQALPYNPLTDDAQAMALIKKFRIQLQCAGGIRWWAEIDFVSVAADPDLNRAICLAVAQRGKE